VKNITVSVPDDVYRRARIRAAERDTSVSALVREFLLEIGEQHQRGLQETIDSILEAHPGFSAEDRLSRDEIHDRDALRRELHSALRDKPKTGERG
jgi:plasmid stability protein